MWPYFLVTSSIALMAFIAPPKRLYPRLWILAFGIIILFVGLRHHVGMDWNNYLIMIQRANYGSLWDSFNAAEPGYALILRLAGQSGWGVYGAYLIGTIIFCAGLFRYAKVTPNPWIALVVAMPFLVVVVAMSAARQTVAIGVLLWITAEWTSASLKKRLGFVALASMFHISALIFLPLVIIGLKMRPITKALLALMLTVLLFAVLETTGYGEYYDRLYLSEQSGQIHSPGALMHVLINAGPGALALLLNKRTGGILLRDSFHQQMAIVTILLLPLAFFSSTSAGRLTLYFFPVSMWFFSALPLAIKKGAARDLVRFGVSVFFMVVLVVWLNFANNAGAHRNYQNALFVERHQLVLCCR